MVAMTAAESPTVCIKTGAGATVAVPIIMTMDTPATVGMTMASGPAIQGTILTIECRSVI